MPYKISVIVPVYNVEPYLRKCLDSLVNQTMKDIEIVLVNDGSTDNSQQIVDEYAESFSFVKSIIKENGGLSDARNEGVQAAEGEYLAFVDSDDWISEDMMLEMYKLAKKHKAEIVFCNLQKVDENGQVFRQLPQLPQLPEKIVLKEDFTVFGEMSCFACNKIFKRELFDEIEFPKGIHFEDIATIPRLFFKASTVAKTDRYFYQYFERTGSITRNYTTKGLDMFEAIARVKKDFEKSLYKNFIQDWKNFVILQGFYSFLAYYAYVKDGEVKRQMMSELRRLLRSENITKKDILTWTRYDENYLFSLSYKKIIYYILQIIRV
ncbi:MAG: glycosyltransferase [Flavobacteriaceae bacterium]|jgi:glycosyltransferase involved in cell wall biosynthesis|nr:glycosyltransferase [Flavobacteriaceae bacterium]